jgi:hypothetical protein
MIDPRDSIRLRGNIMSTMFDYVSAALAEFEGLLIAEILAGNTITGTPAAACGRVAFGIACALVRSLEEHSTQSAQAG